MKYVYVLASNSVPNQTYVGVTGDIERRLREHNSGKCRHTRKYRAWECIVALRFADDMKADQFEKYLKSGSGRAFLKRHFI